MKTLDNPNEKKRPSLTVNEKLSKCTMQCEMYIWKEMV